MNVEPKLDSDQRPSLYDSVMSDEPMVMKEPVPLDLAKFRAMSRYDRERDGPEFFRREHIKNYIEKKWAVELHNKSCYGWLLEIKNIYPDKEQAINEKIQGFLKAIRRTDKPFTALRIKDVEAEKEIEEVKRFWSKGGGHDL